MNFTGGLFLVAIAAVLIFLGRPKGPISRFIQTYIVGQIYIMTSMVLGVLGIAIIIRNWPL